MNVRWLGWDGHSLRWELDRTSPGYDFALCLDGTVFRRYLNSASNEQEFELDFAFSPSGREALEFNVVAQNQSIQSGAWRVIFGRPAAPKTDAWSARAPGLAPLQACAAIPAVDMRRLPPVAVVVPIYNSGDAVRRCVDALLRWTPSRARLIIVDDASTDPSIDAILDAVKSRGDTTVLRNARNRGYTVSSNVGMLGAGDADVVLLNSDTEVGPRWLQSLQLAVTSAHDIATATAVSDNAGAFSVPELEQFCPLPTRWSLIETQRAVLQQAGRRFPELPTGNGFCMYIKRSVIERVGVLDETAFPSGYGEENDFCQRASGIGMRHVIVGNVLVHHERSASFGDARRAALGIQGMAVLRERYPDYEAQVGATLHSFERRVLDYRVRRTYADADGTYARRNPLPRLLLVGAVEPSAAQLVRISEKYDLVFLHAAGEQMQLSRRDAQAAPEILATHAPGTDDRAACLRNWLADYAIEAVCAAQSDALSMLIARLAGEQDICRIDLAD